MVICFVKIVIYYAPDHYFENKIISIVWGKVLLPYNITQKDCYFYVGRILPSFTNSISTLNFIGPFCYIAKILDTLCSYENLGDTGARIKIIFPF